MVKHIILWQFKDELSDDRKKELGQEIKGKLEALKGRIPGLIDIHVQADILPTSNADLKRIWDFLTDSKRQMTSLKLL